MKRISGTIYQARNCYFKVTFYPIAKKYWNIPYTVRINYHSHAVDNRYRYREEYEFNTESEVNKYLKEHVTPRDIEPI